MQAREALGYGEKDLVILLMPALQAQELRHVYSVAHYCISGDAFIDSYSCFRKVRYFEIIT